MNEERERTTIAVLFQYVQGAITEQECTFKLIELYTPELNTLAQQEGQ
jgi:hypothetical protein